MSAEAVPAMPEGVTDRPAEIWEPLLAVADTAGGHWPETARAACTHFVTEAAATGHGSIGVRLLGDLRALYAERDTDRMATADMLTALNLLDEAPWADYEGKPLDARRLGRLLSRYGVASRTIKLPGGAAKGYRTDGPGGLADAWSRYLETTVTAVTSVTSQVSAVTDAGTVTDTSVTTPPIRNRSDQHGYGSNGNPPHHTYPRRTHARPTATTPPHTWSHPAWLPANTSPSPTSATNSESPGRPSMTGAPKAARRGA